MQQNPIDVSLEKLKLMNISLIHKLYSYNFKKNRRGDGTQLSL